MARFNKNALLVNLDKKIAHEREQAEAKLEAWQEEYDEWKRTAVDAYAAAVFMHDPDESRQYNGPDSFRFSPPYKPNDKGCSRAEEMRARLLLIAEDKNGNVQLRERDPILGLAVNCHG